ncbi:class IV adenylate cyclase [Maridesulfovibrio salexigens]|uniref:Adenylate cyclase n=1 Tax=Maridesulfovibrio salexigens (strain ATCC 14822 / DSM 2638 / NCIMB 8403 / VKM B-1763) TaxID=526222 RepID=C6BTW0_MARSD|nr:class IV adenylate cyclase [Maridesulfovibrio salexigens]ACS79890.1 adenylate cyclase [Maridesulfovibrio salexigens DSM 2638]
MALETELKYLNADHDKARMIMKEQGAKMLTRHYERNVVLDDPGRTLYKRSALLRVRQAEKVTMTVKRIPAGPVSGKAKVYIEHETEVSNFDETVAALQVLGYSPVFSYEKIREEWEFAGCHICLDQLPFGPFIEIEGSEDGILSCADKLGLSPDAACTKTYHELNRDHRMDCGLEPDENFVFTSEEVQELL